MQHPYRVAAVIMGMVLGAGVGLWLLIALRTFIILVLVAAFLATALDRPTNFFQRRLRLRRRGIAVLIVMLVGAAIIATISYAVSKPIRTQSSTFRQDLPSRVERVKDFPLLGGPLKDIDVRGETERFINELPERLSHNRELILGVAQTA